MFDFWRPLGRREAVVDGHYSIDCYLEALSGAYRDWRGKAEAKEIVRRGTSALPSEQLAAIGYHVPFCKMAKKAHARLRRCDLDDVLGAFDEAREEREGATSFERQVAPSLTLCSRVGNIYTGSLYLGFAGMLQASATELAGKRIGLFSYGSGCVSEFFSGVVGKNAAERIQRARLDEVLGSPRAGHGGGVRATDGARAGDPAGDHTAASHVPLHRRERAPPPVRGRLSRPEDSPATRCRRRCAVLARPFPRRDAQPPVPAARCAGGSVRRGTTIAPPGPANEVGSCDGSTQR